MNLLVKNVAIADPQSKFNNQQCDVRVENGKIKNIGKLTADKNETVFDAQGAFLTPGFFDLNCVAGDPGFETKEDIQTLTATAKAGGFTGLALLPQTSPVVQSKSQVEYIINRAKNNLVDVLPVGAISQNREAKELAELFDMQQAGAVAFSDGDKALQDDGFMSRALQYAKGFDALLMVYPENKSIAGKSQINESKNSVLLGMKGLPALAEEMHIARDIFLASYNETKIHISNISTAGAVALIRKAKKDGVQVSCDVTAHHLVFTEDLLSDFDSNYKVKPPLRGKADVKALIAGLKDGTIDAITSQHRPEEIEFKNVEFEIAHYGIIALQTVLPLLLKAGLDIALIAEKLAINPRKLLNLTVPVIEEGIEANFTIFNTAEKWLYNAANNHSKSANSPLLGAELTGKVTLVYNNNQYWEN
ncbi:Dihydroorotase [Pedobacter sp. Bi27]|uniref:dihydroorotase n=1 Tax=unclassified Pedobacter TaxID=2628915 RepID=UPI001D5F90D7|nr:MULTISPECIES: dihydroorotase [unclassified Pedobacter]CAH0151320.1 Dihydroorotase [Pedobacter sp. Bi126]CAH0151823.1 Dihydroorotase [Pedobacter sp. Bi27]CAH0206922.1 Dihydroorotase [Pedobacter sp. Bi36]